MKMSGASVEKKEREQANEGEAGVKKEEGKLIAVVRVRGTRGVRRTVSETLKLLGLTRKNHCIVVRQARSLNGMLDKAKDYVTWGEVSATTLAALLEKTPCLAGGKRLSSEYVAAHTGFRDVKELVSAVHEGITDLGVVPGLKKVFRLAPPRKGTGPVKKQYPAGACGPRGEKINELIQKMI